MKLAEALIRRADKQKGIRQLQSRMNANALTEENTAPYDDPMDLLTSVSKLIAELEQLVVAINRTNVHTTLPGTQTTMMEALAHRDALQAQYNILSSLVDSASATALRYRATEIRMVTSVDIRTLRAVMDTLAQQRRDLDLAIQSANWTTELEQEAAGA